jgi:hypothetical protein
MSVSRYILDRGPGEFECHIRDTKEWQEVEDDPIFCEIATDCKLMSIQELSSRCQLDFQTHTSNEVKNNDTNETINTAEQTNDIHSGQDDHIDEDTHTKNRDQDDEHCSDTLSLPREYSDWSLEVDTPETENSGNSKPLTKEEGFESHTQFQTLFNNQRPEVYSTTPRSKANVSQ